MSFTSFIMPAASVVVVTVGGMTMGWFQILKQTNTLLKEQNLELKNTVKELQNQHLENVSKLASLQAQIDQIKDIPLMSIDNSLKNLSQSNEKILSTLLLSARTLEESTKNASQSVKEVKVTMQDRGVQ